MTGLALITDDILRELAQGEGVCVRPMLHRVTDTQTGRTHVVPIRCGSTREAVCPSCAQRSRRLRMQQCREGWHLEHEPDLDRAGQADLQSDHTLAEDDSDQDVETSRRVRSTRRRQDAPNLPTLPVQPRTVGQVFESADGRRWRPSMFATFTLPSYGPVKPDGTPRDPSSYDYRRAALDAMHFPKLLDRFWQNLRRSVGYQVQYFAAMEPQRRLAPHLHAAIRGAIPRKVFREVVAATYHQVWWPPSDNPVFTDDLPTWTGDDHGYLDPATGQPLPTWQEALDALDDNLKSAVGPAHVVRFGRQLDLQGIIATASDADRRVGYLTKYLTKSVADTYGEPDQRTPAQAAHLNRLHAQVRWLPCSTRCWNWLRYGIQPDQASDGMVPGRCPGKAHRQENLGCGGRRVLVSRKWTGKTLVDHQADRAAVVREALAAAGIEMPETDRYSATATDDLGRPRFVWTPLDLNREDRSLRRQAMVMAIEQRRRWRAQYEAAKQRPPILSVSATGDSSVDGGGGGDA